MDRITKKYDELLANNIYSEDPWQMTDLLHVLAERRVTQIRRPVLGMRNTNNNNTVNFSKEMDPDVPQNQTVRNTTVPTRTLGNTNDVIPAWTGDIHSWAIRIRMMLQARGICLHHPHLTRDYLPTLIERVGIPETYLTPDTTFHGLLEILARPRRIHIHNVIWKQRDSDVKPSSLYQQILAEITETEIISDQGNKRRFAFDIMHSTIHKELSSPIVLMDDIPAKLQAEDLVWELKGNLQSNTGTDTHIIENDERSSSTNASGDITDWGAISHTTNMNNNNVCCNMARMTINSTKFTQTAKPTISPRHNTAGECWYHDNYKEAARKCISPCIWQKDRMLRRLP